MKPNPNPKIDFVGITSEETKVDYTGESLSEVKIGFAIQGKDCTQREVVEAFIADVTEFTERYQKQ